MSKKRENRKVLSSLFLQTYAVQGFAKNFCTVLYVFEFFGKKGRIYLAFNTLGSENAGEGKTNVFFDSVAVVSKAGNGKNGIVAGEDRSYDSRNTSGNCIEGSTFSLDNFAACFSYVFFYAAKEYFGLFFGVVLNVTAILSEVHTDDAGNAPGEGGRVAVFTEYVSVNVLCTDGKTVRNHGTKS